MWIMWIQQTLVDLHRYKYSHSMSPSSSQMDGPFQDIELLKSRPAHMAVFMRYVFTQLLDPNPLVSHYVMC